MAENRAGGVDGIALPRQEQPESGDLDFLLVRSKGKVVPVWLDELIWAEKADNYIRLITTRGDFLIRRTLESLEDLLPAGRFARIHRSTLVSLRHVRSLEPWFSGGYIVELANGKQLKASKNYAAKLFSRYGAA